MTQPDSDAPDAPDALFHSLERALTPHLLLVRRLGKGGMGEVFLARDPALRRSVAVKVLSPTLATDADARARFEREAQAVAGLSHPNVLAVFSVGELTDGTPYFVMPYVTGLSMADRITAEGPLSVAEARRVLGEVASALAAAHAKGIIHRDIKPANVLFDEEAGRALVADFGIAAILPQAQGLSSDRITQTGMMIGTPTYMSPEQLLQEAATDRTDMYALGLLAYELLTGRHTFEVSTPHELVAAHLRDVPKPLNEVRDDVDIELSTLVGRCLEKDPAKRPSAAETAQRLAPGGGALLEWPPPGLEGIHGAVDRVGQFVWMGATLTAIVSLTLLVAGPSIRDFLSSGVSLVLLITGVAAAGMLAWAMVRGVRLSLAMRRGMRIGYGRLTVLEVGVDRLGDTGHLIAGTHRFVALNAEARDDLRRQRIASALAPLLSGIGALLALISWARLASTATLGAGFLITVPLLLVGAQLVRVAVRRAEQKRAPVQHSKRRVLSATELTRLTPAWYQAFERIRSGQRLSGGTSGTPATAFVLVGAASIILVLGALATFAIAISGSFGPLVYVLAAPKFANTTVKYSLAITMRPWALPADSRITPQEAGAAFHALRPRDQAKFEAFPEREGVVLAPPPWTEALPESLFVGLRHPSSTGATAAAVIDSLPRRLTRAELAWLERIARYEGWHQYAIVARAPALDNIAGRFVLPFTPLADAISLPLPRFVSLKEYGYANAGRIRYFLETNKPDSAVLAAREAVSFGLRMADDGRTLIETLIGVVIVGIARDELYRTYRAIGSPKADSVEAAWGAAAARVEDRTAAGDVPTSPLIDPRAERARWIQVLTDSTTITGLRWEALTLLSLSVCTNARELFLGPNPDVLAAVTQMRERFAPFPSDSALIELFMMTPERMGRNRNSESPMMTSGEALSVRVTEFAGSLTGNDRIVGCMRFLTYVN